MLVLGGASESATRFLRELLAQNDAIAADPEFPHLCQLVDLRRRMRDSIDRGFIDLFCGYEELDAGLRTLLAGVYTASLPDSADRLVCEATPANVHVFDDLAELLPGARFVHVLHDPREAVAEHLARGDPGFPWRRLEGAIREVHSALEAGFEAGRKLPERVLTLALERLLERPETELGRLEAFLGLEGRALRLPGAVREPPRWLQLLSPAQKVAASKAFETHPGLIEAGYDLRTRDLGIPVRVLGSTVHALWNAAGPLERSARRTAREWRDRH